MQNYAQFTAVQSFWDFIRAQERELSLHIQKPPPNLIKALISLLTKLLLASLCQRMPVQCLRPRSPLPLDRLACFSLESLCWPARCCWPHCSPVTWCHTDFHLPWDPGPSLAFLSASHRSHHLLQDTFASSLLCPVSKTIGQHTPVWPLKDSWCNEWGGWTTALVNQ